MLTQQHDLLEQLLDEQAALRRVATLVARGVDPADILASVAEEMEPAHEPRASHG